MKNFENEKMRFENRQTIYKKEEFLMLGKLRKYMKDFAISPPDKAGNQTLTPKGKLDINPSGSLTLKNVINKGTRNSNSLAVTGYSTASIGSGSNFDFYGSPQNSYNYPSSSFTVAGEYITSNRSWLCNENDSGSISEWRENAVTIAMPVGKTCPQIGLGVSKYRMDASDAGADFFGKVPMWRWIDMIPQHCEPIGVMMQIQVPFSGSGLGQSPGNIYVETVGIQMAETGLMNKCGLTWEVQRNGYGGGGVISNIDGRSPAMPICSGNVDSNAPLGDKGGVRPRYYSDYAYFYGSASQATCCNLPLGSTGEAGEYAYFPANQGGGGIFGPLRHDGMFYTGYTGDTVPTPPGWNIPGNLNAAVFNMKYGISACHNGVDELQFNSLMPNGSGLTASHIQNTNWPMNQVLINFNFAQLDEPCEGIMDVCFYYRRVAGGYDNSIDFYNSTPCMTGSGYTNGEGRGIPEKCASGSVIVCLEP